MSGGHVSCCERTRSCSASTFSTRPVGVYRVASRRAFSLLEIMLALAILGAALTVLSQIAGTGVDAAREARDLVIARVICQAKLSQLLIAGTMPQSVDSAPVDNIDSESITDFVYSVRVQPSQFDGLLAVRVQVDAVNPNGGAPLVSYSLDRWIVDPSLDLIGAEAEELAAQQAAQEAAAAATSEEEP